MAERKWVEHLQMGVHRVKVALGDRKRVAVGVSRDGDATQIHVEGAVIMAPGLRRWRHYRRGVTARLASVTKRYGLDGIPAESGGDDGPWAVDVGGYMGEWSLYMLRQGYKVLVIEPDPLAARCLRANLTAHAPDGAVWRHDPRVANETGGEVTFYSSPTHADGSVFPSDKHASTAITLHAARLDDIIAEHIGDAPIYAFKMDAEGAEPEVLAGAPALLAQVQRVGIDAGVEREGADTVDAVSDILREAGLTVAVDENLTVTGTR